MMIENILSGISHFYPEIAITVTICVVIIVDLFKTKENHAAGWILFAGLLVSGALALSQYGGMASVFYEMIAVDPFAVYFKVFLLIASLFIILFSMKSSELERYGSRISEYYMLLGGMILGMFLMVGASNVLMMYLAFEMTSISSYVLAGFTRREARSAEGSMKFILFGAVSSGIMLYGITLLCGMTGETSLYAINEALSAGVTQPVVLLLSLLMITAGLGFKIAVVPFHFWAPDVYEGASIPFTAFLSVASKMAAFAMLIRFFSITFKDVDAVTSVAAGIIPESFNWNMLLGIMAAAAMVVGNLTALRQDNIKRMLAYSSIAHAGYILMGVVVLTESGLSSVLIYAYMYLFMNLGAFFVAMLFSNKLDTESIEAYKGLGHRAPLEGVALTVFLVALTGLPPTAGFIAKLYIFGAAISAGWIWLVSIAALTTVISLFYYIRVVRNLYFFKPAGSAEPLRFDLGSRVILMLLLVPSLILGLYFSPVIELARNSITLWGM